MAEGSSKRTSTWRRVAERFYDREAQKKTDLTRRRVFVQAYKAIWTRLELQPQARVLDAGCGCGEASEALSGYGAWVVGIDVSMESLHEARLRMDSGHFIRADLEHLPIKSGAFDGSVAISSLEFCQDKEAALNELHRVLMRDAPLYADVRSADFPLYRLPRKALRWLERLGFLAPYPAPGFRDLQPSEWQADMESCGFRLGKVYPSVWPWNFDSPVARCKNALIALVRASFPIDLHYMIGILARRAAGRND